MKKDYLYSPKMFYDDDDFDFEEKSLTFQKTKSHQNRFFGTEKSLKINENQRNQQINEGN